MRLGEFFGLHAGQPVHRARSPVSLGLDFHSHLLPAVDDGIQDFAGATSAINSLKQIGFTGAVITPHIHKDVYDNSSLALHQAFTNFTALLAKENIDFYLHLAGEYFTDEHFLTLIERGEILSVPVAAEQWVVVELPHFQEASFASVCLAALVSRGYRPVIAHVERYRFVSLAPQEWLERFARYGAILQGDIGSLAGQHGAETRRFATWLADRDLVQIWGTDIHHQTQIESFIRPGLAHLRPTGRLNTILDPLISGEMG
jgi:tyrosine-protein phosphatase YwqE